MVWLRGKQDFINNANKHIKQLFPSAVAKKVITTEIVERKNTKK